MVMSLIIIQFCATIFDDKKRAVSGKETALNYDRNKHLVLKLHSCFFNA
jgi:hypothetical protein